MSLGAVLVRPQPLIAPQTPITVADVIIAFAESLLKDPEATLAALPIMAAEATNSVRDLLSGFEEPMRLADGKVRALFQPFVGPVNAIISAFDGEPLSILPNVLQALMQFLQALTADNIVQLLQGLFDLIQNDLGFSGGGPLGVLTTMITHMVEKLQMRVENGDLSDEAVALYDFGTGLDDILTLLEKDITLPSLDATARLAEVRAVWANLGIDRLIALIEAILAKGEQLLLPLATIAQAVVDVEVSVKVTPQAANGNGTPTPSAPSENPSDPIAWYASWVSGGIVRFPADTGQSTNLFDNQYLLGFTYKSVSRETMEKIAYHTAWLAPTIELVLFHGTSMEKGDITNNLVQLLYDGTDAGLMLFGKKKIPWGWGWLPLLTFPFLGPTAESGGRGCWWWHDIADAVENLMYRRWCWEMREALLSILTLLNYDDAAFQQILSTRSNQVEKDATTLASNPYYFDGLVIAMIEIGSLFLFGFFRDRGAFYLDTGVSLFSLPPIQQAVSIGWLWPIAMTIVGYVIARPLSGQPLFSSSGLHVFAVFFRERLLGKYSLADAGSGFWTVARCVFAFLLYPLEYLIYRFVFTTGDTDGGALALDTQGNDAPQKFLGYPDPSTSPYLIPWVNSERMCVQGNLGIVSHNAHDGTGQVYAVDIEMAEGQDIVASRAGIVVNIRDTIATGDHSNGWNFVEILHLVLNAPTGNVPVPLPTPPMPALPAGVSLPATFFIAGPGVPADNLPSSAIAINTAGGVPTKVTLLSGTLVPAGTKVYIPILLDPATSSPAFQDGATPIPAGTLFPPYWDNVGNLLLDFLPPLHPAGAFMTAAGRAALTKPYYQSFTNPFDSSTKIAFLLAGHDRGVGPEPGQVVLNGNGPLIPVKATFATYGHCLNKFMTSPATSGATTNVYRSETVADVLGQFVKQGQVIMLADNTGDSAFDHVHMQVSGQISGPPGSGTGANWSIPFVLSDLKHNISNGIYKAIAYRNGVPVVFTSYSGTVTRIPPA